MPETKSEILSSNVKDNNISTVSVFKTADFRNASQSTASSILPSHLDVPDVFNQSSFLAQSPIIGAQIFLILNEEKLNGDNEEELENASEAEDLYSLLTNGYECDLQGFEIELARFLNTKLHKNHDFQNAFFDDANHDEKSHSNSSSHALLKNLKLYIQIKQPVYCAQMRFGHFKEGQFSNPREIISYLLIFYWIFIRDKTQVDKLISQWDKVSTTKTIYTFYKYLMHVTNNIQAF